MPRIVHEDVDAAELFAARGDDLRAGSLQRQVGRRVSHVPALAGDLRRCRAEFFFRARCKKHSGAFFRKKLSDGPANSAAGAGNQRNAILEFHGEIEDRVNQEWRQAGRRGTWGVASVACWGKTDPQVRCNSASVTLEWPYRSSPSPYFRYFFIGRVLCIR